MLCGAEAGVVAVVNVDVAAKRVDVVFAVYPNFTRSSGMLSKAALYRRPILVASGYCMAERVAAYRLGMSADQDSVAECETALRQLLSRGTPDADYDGFAKDFSFPAFESRLVDFLATCLAGTACLPVKV